jgi:hypothetical protein
MQRLLVIASNGKSASRFQPVMSVVLFYENIRCVDAYWPNFEHYLSSCFSDPDALEKEHHAGRLCHRRLRRLFACCFFVAHRQLSGQ